MSPSRHYCLTFFTQPIEWEKVSEKVRYAIHGIETCPNTGKTHWQSYVELFKPMRLTAIKKLYCDNTIHCETRKGSRDEARSYCMKDGLFTEFGEWTKGQGHRTDLDELGKALFLGSKNIEAVMEQSAGLYCRYRRGLMDLASAGTARNLASWRDVKTTLITGPTGAGKTRQVVENNPLLYKIEGHNLDWWQDYKGEEAILIDDYDNDVPITTMLNLLDGYKLRLNIKGSHTYANWLKVYITTNLRPHELHQKAKPAHQLALKRRITTIINLWDPTDESED